MQLYMCGELSERERFIRRDEHSWKLNMRRLLRYWSKHVFKKHRCTILWCLWPYLFSANKKSVFLFWMFIFNFSISGYMNCTMLAVFRQQYNRTFNYIENMLSFGFFKRKKETEIRLIRYWSNSMNSFSFLRYDCISLLALINSVRQKQFVPNHR